MPDSISSSTASSAGARVDSSTITATGAQAEVGAAPIDAGTANEAGPIANIPVQPDHFAQTYYSPSHLQQIRELYVSGTAITNLPAQLEGERAELDAARNLATLSSSARVASAALPSASANASSQTSRPANALTNTARGATPTGTAGSTSSAQ